MKTSILCRLGTSALLAAAQPGLHRRHADFHAKRDVTVVATQVVQELVYYVIEGGKTISTMTTHITQAAPPTEPTPAAPVVNIQQKEVDAEAGNGRGRNRGGNRNNVQTTNVNYVAPSQTPVASPAPVVNTPSAANPPAYPSSSSESAPVESAQPESPSSGGGSTAGLGVAYSPYTTGGSGCRNVEADIQAIVKDARGFSLIRLYSASDCEVLSTVGKVIKQTGSKMKIVLNPMGDKRQYDLDNLTTAFKEYLSFIDSVLVTNEAGSGASAATAGTVSSYKQKWSGQPFSVAGAEAFGQMTPAVVEASDFCAVNIHAFQQPDCTGGSADAGNCIIKKMGQSTLGCGNKRVMVSESGWPSAGGAGYTAGDQATAIAALQKLPGSNKIDSMILFMAYDDPTKGGAECEKHLGFMS